MNSPLRILCLEDDPADAELLQNTLETEGITCTLTRVETECDFRGALQQGGFHLILADYTLPSFDGLSALRIALEQRPDLPFIFVSGTLGEDVAIEDLKIGATDYVLKTRLSRLVPAVERAMREAGEKAERKRAEQSARRSEKELRDAIEIIPAMVFIALPGPSNAFANRPWREYTGLSAEETSGSGWQTAIHPEDLERHVKKWQVSSATGEPFDDEARFRRGADGEYRWFLVRVVPLHDELGNVLKWYGVLTDIQDRKQAEALLAGEKRILEMVAKGDSLPEILNVLCRLVEEQVSGVLASILLAQDGRLLHGAAPSLPKAYTEAIDGVAIGPSVASCGTAAYLGKQVIVEDIATDPLWSDYRAVALAHSLRACWSKPIFSPEARVIGTFAIYYREPRRPSRPDQEVIEHITKLAGIAIQRKLMEETAQAASARLQGLVRIAPDAIISVDSDQRIILFNQAAERIFGYTPAEVIGRSLDLLVPGRSRELHRKDIDDFARSPEVARKLGERREVIGIRSNGSEFPAEASISKLNAGGELVYTVMLRDITERKRAEEDLRHLEAELAHMDRVSILGELAASIAHEVNQPLSGVVSGGSACLHWLAEDPPNLEEVRKGIRSIVGAGKHAGEVIARIRALTKRSPAPKEKLDLNETIREVLVLVANEAKTNKVRIRTLFADGLSPVLGDRVQFQQVVLNLFINAIEAMSNVSERARELVITTRNLDQEQVQVTVEDSGIGIDPNTLHKIFDPFYTTKSTGMGMGLSISRSILQQHGGRLWATANHGPGTSFHFALPKYREEELNAEAARV